MKKRRIAIVTGTRAEYGLLRSTIEALGKHKNVERQVIVTGMHLLKRFGHTAQEVEQDLRSQFGLAVAARMPVMDEDAIESPTEMAQTVGRAIQKFAPQFQALQSDIVLVLGDRVEVFAAGVAAALTGRVVAHIHGGDVTRGGYDESMRHALTKFAHLHFTATKNAKERVIRMGENPKNVYCFGAPGVDELLRETKTRANDTEVLKRFGLASRDYVLLVQHSVSTEPDKAKAQIRETLKALRALDRPVLAFYPNSDLGGVDIIAALEHAATTWPDFRVVKNLPRLEYLSLLANAGALCGNSSSGIIEASYLHTPVVNIGERQEGRECAANVIHVPHHSPTIAKALRCCFNDTAFIESCRRVKQVYGNGNAGHQIAKILATHLLPKRLTHKKLAY